MTLRISGKHMDIGDALRARIEARLAEAIGKYFDGSVSGHVVLSKSAAARAGTRFSAECTVHLSTGLTLQATAAAPEAAPAFEAAADRFETRLRRYKRRLKSHGAGQQGGDGEATAIPYRVVAPLDDEDTGDEVPEDFAPAVVAERTVALKTMSVAAAVIELDATDSPVLVFRNPASQGVNIVYRRPDGNIGWIDPSAVAAAPGRAGA